MAAANAREELRQKQQGFGRPIIATTFKGKQFVAVRNRLHYGEWKTFFDFLSDYVRGVLGAEWGNSEIAKPLVDRHPILQWYDSVCRLQAETIKEPGKVHSSPMNGAAAAYFELAYNLYLLAHNVELQGRLLVRLRNPDQFRGAYYECFVAALFVLAGFELALEDESAGDTTHCEFVATSKDSGRCFSVEAKTRAPNKRNADVGNQLVGALRKAAEHPRVVFIDVNLPPDAIGPDSWRSETVFGIKRRESLKINGVDAPPAYVVVTNRPFQYDLESRSFGSAFVAEGFKISDFGYSARFTSLIEAFKAEQRHAEVFSVLKALLAYSIPSTFDGEIPEFAFGEAERRFVVGRTYDLAEVEDGAAGTLESGCVAEEGREAHLVFHLHDGRRIIVRADLTEAEVAAYRAHPDTFFGVHQSTVRRAETPLELFEFFHDCYRATSREKLLEFMKAAPDIEVLSNLSTEELLLVYCERVALSASRPRNTSSDAPPGG